uniref:Uncharacterized protein n=1 Tax=Cairina moschata TaxID=8855 RepID=A0A8C3C8R7_CAIMO
MAAAFLLLLALLAAAQAEEVSDPCQGGPASWCRDVATAVRCQKEQQCRLLWDSLGTWDEDEGDAAPPGKGKRCSICTKVLQQLKKMVGDDPDEDTVNAALRKVCGAMKGLGRLCKAMVKKFGQEIAEALQNDDDPQDVCTSLKFCKGCAAGL